MCDVIWMETAVHVSVVSSHHRDDSINLIKVMGNIASQFIYLQHNFNLLRETEIPEMN